MDAPELERLIQLMERHDLVEIEIGNEQGRTVRLRKREGAAPAPQPAPAASIATPSASASPTGAAPEAGVLIRSPMVGTFFRSPSPESPVFVEVGDAVEPDSTVCIVEAMKVFNEIKADVAGTIAEVLVENADGVEYDTALFRVIPRA